MRVEKVPKVVLRDVKQRPQDVVVFFNVVGASGGDLDRFVDALECGDSPIREIARRIQEKPKPDPESPWSAREWPSVERCHFRVTTSHKEEAMNRLEIQAHLAGFDFLENLDRPYSANGEQ